MIRKNYIIDPRPDEQAATIIDLKIESSSRSNNRG